MPLIIFCIISGFFLLYLFLLMPRMYHKKSFLIGKKFAHRGYYYGNIPENSLLAFHNAKIHNLPVELDVHLTKDKQVVVFHDSDLKRMCGVSLDIKDLTFRELKNYHLNGTGETIPLLSDALRILGGMGLICEIKPYDTKSTKELCEKTYNILQKYSGNFCIESFSPFVLLWFRKNHPQVLRGQLSKKFKLWGKDTISWYQALPLRDLLVNVMGRPDFIAYDYERKSFGLILCKKVFGAVCIAWTVKGEENIKNVMSAGFFDSVIFEKSS